MKKALVLSFVAMFVIAVALPVFAAEGKAAEGKKSNPVVDFFRGLFYFPAKVTEKSVKVGTETTKKAVGIGTTEVKDVGEMVTGKPEKIKDVVVSPLKGAADTTVEASKSVLVPVEAAKESFPPKEE